MAKSAFGSAVWDACCHYGPPRRLSRKTGWGRPGTPMAAQPTPLPRQTLGHPHALLGAGATNPRWTAVLTHSLRPASPAPSPLAAVPDGPRPHRQATPRTRFRHRRPDDAKHRLDPPHRSPVGLRFGRRNAYDVWCRWSRLAWRAGGITRTEKKPKRRCALGFCPRWPPCSRWHSGEHRPDP